MRDHRLLAVIVMFIVTSALGATVDEIRTLRGESLFRAAALAFADRNWKLADKWLERYSREHPTSKNWVKARLMRGQSLYMLGDYSGCHSWLNDVVERNMAGNRASEYRFWMAESRLRAGNETTAAEVFRDVAETHPVSGRKAEAAIAHAMALARKQGWPQVIEILRPEDSPFQVYLKNQPEGRLASTGKLLLAEAMLRVGGLRLDALEVIRSLENQELSPDLRQRLFLLKADILAGGSATREEAIGLLGLIDGDNIEVSSEALSLKAGILLSKGDLNGAALALELLMKPKRPVGFRRDAALRLLHLVLTKSVSRAVNLPLIEDSLDKSGNSVLEAVVHFSLGELRLSQLTRLESASVLIGDREMLTARAREHFSQILHPDLGAQADLGTAWADWHDGRFMESGTNFFQAANTLSTTESKAYAHFKAAEAFSRARDHTNSIARCQAILTRTLVGGFADRARLLQLWGVLSTVHQAPNSSATETVADLIRGIESIPLRSQARMMAARLEERLEGAGTERKFLAQIVDNSNAGSFRGIAGVELIRPLIEAGKWKDAAVKYQMWLEENNETVDAELAATVQFDRAWLLAKSGDFDSALVKFQEFAKARPSDPRAAKALLWAADHFFNLGDTRNLVRAETTCQHIYSKLPGASLEDRLRARILAGLSAVGLNKFESAREYLQPVLAGDVTRFKAEAAFVLGDAVLRDPRRNSKQIKSAIVEFQKIVTLMGSENVRGLTVLRARCRIGDCHYQIATGDNNHWEMALKQYREVRKLASDLPGNPPVLFHAMMGMAMVLENREPEPDRQEAVELYSEVFHGATAIGNNVDGFWIRQSGLAAGRLHREMGQHEEAIKIYERLASDRMFSGMKPSLEKIIRDSKLKLKANPR